MTILGITEIAILSITKIILVTIIGRVLVDLWRIYWASKK